MSYRRMPPTEAQLEGAARHQLAWEALCLLDSLGHRGNAIVFHRAIGVLLHFTQGRRRDFNHPMGMHDALLHTRVIADFLYCPSACRNPQHADDIEAGDYLTNWPGVDVLGKENRLSINKSMTHLSRTRPERQVMSVPERKRLGVETLLALKDFIDHVEGEQTSWFEDLREAIDTARL